MKKLWIFLILAMATYFLIPPPETIMARITDAEKAEISAPVQLLPNSGFEARLSGWEKTGTSVLSLDSSTPLYGKLSALWDPGAASELLRSAAIQLDDGMKGETCLIEMRYQWPSGVSGEIELQVLDQTNAVLASLPLEPATDPRSAQLNFSCPDPSTTQVKWALASTADAAQIEVDRLFIGSGKNTISVSQAEFFGSVRTPGTASCFWSGGNTASVYTSYTATAACPVATAKGKVLAPDTKIPAVKIPKLEPGIYRIIATGRFQQANTANYNACFRFHDGTSELEGMTCADSSSGNVLGGPLESFYEVTSPQSNVQLEIRYASSSGTVNLTNTQSTDDFIIRLYRYPLNSAEALNLETSGFEYEGYIDGSSDILVTGPLAQSSFNPFANVSLSLTDIKGNADVSCTSGNNTGDTCSAGSEHVGIQIDLPGIDDYEVCFQFLRSWSSINAATSDNIFSSEAIEMADTDGSNAVISYNTTGGRYEGASNATGIGSDSVRLCNIFRGVGGRKRFIFTAALNITSANSNYSLGTINSDSSGVVDRRVHISVRKANQQMPAPVFTEIKNLNGEWSTPEPLTFTAETSGTYTKGTTTVDEILYQREGKWANVHFTYRQTSAGSNGVGRLLFRLPAGLQADLSITRTCTTAAATSDDETKLMGNFGANTGALNAAIGGYCCMVDADDMACAGYIGGSTYNFISNGLMGLGNTTTQFGARLRIPISGW